MYVYIYLYIIVCIFISQYSETSTILYNII